jgi:hypothetical protein
LRKEQLEKLSQHGWQGKQATEDDARARPTLLGNRIMKRLDKIGDAGTAIRQ